MHHNPDGDRCRPTSSVEDRQIDIGSHCMNWSARISNENWIIHRQIVDHERCREQQRRLWVRQTFCFVFRPVCYVSNARYSIVCFACYFCDMRSVNIRSVLFDRKIDFSVGSISFWRGLSIVDDACIRCCHRQWQRNRCEPCRKRSHYLTSVGHSNEYQRCFGHDRLREHANLRRQVWSVGILSTSDHRCIVWWVFENHHWSTFE